MRGSELVLNSREDLVSRLQQNDELAYHELVETYGEKILHLAYTIVGDKQMAEDVVQESFLTLYEKLYTFRGDSSLYTWLTRIAINKAKNKVRPSLLKKITYVWDIKRKDDKPLPQECFETKERQGMIRKVLMVLPLKYKEVLYLYYYEEMKVKEIAQVLDLSESGVKSRLHRGRELFKKLLEERGLEK